MSYAEHGPRIFLTGRFNPNPLKKYGEFFVPRKRSEGRLKLFDSCTDLRAWSPNALNNCHYFRDVVENPIPRGKIVPYDVMIESLIVLGNQTQTELASVRRQLEKYKSLQLTPEQERQLREIDGESSEDVISIKDLTSLKGSRGTEDDLAIPKRPETPIQSTCSSSTNFHAIEVHERSSDDESSTENFSEDSREVLVSSEMDPMEDADVPEKRRRSGKTYRGFNENDRQAIIIEKDSEIIALKNELGAKEAELEELSRRIESALNEKEAIIDDLKGNLKISQEDLLGMSEKIEEWKKKTQTSKCMIDQLRSALAEKSQECSAQFREIEALREQITETEILREERDSLTRTLDEAKAAIRERNELMKRNQEQAMHLEDQEDEIKNLLGLVKKTTAKYDERQMRMKSALDDLRAKLEAKNSELSQFEAQYVSIRRQVSETLSISEIPTPEIYKIKCSLEEDLQELANELMKRSGGQQNSRFRHEEIDPRTREEIDEWHRTTARRDNWEREKEFMECTIEQLTMQVSASNAANEEQDEIHKHIVSKFRTAVEKIQQLIVELEPYGEERPSLIETINCLNDALKDARATSESRGLIAEQQDLAEVLNEHRRRCEEYEKRVAKLSKLQNNSAKIIEKVRRQNDQRLEEDEKIDNVLGIRAKRSIETIEKLSAALRGAGDFHDREMAKKENELEARNAEIAKLREQVASHRLRGQGDQAQHESSYETTRMKNELKLLHSELAKTRESLQRTKDKLKSHEFRLKGSDQGMKELRALCRKHEKEAENAIESLNRLMKENEGLNKTVLMTGELQIQVDEMKLKLESLQDENAKLNNELAKTNELCAEYKNTIIDLTDREMRAKEAFERVEEKWKTLVLQRASQIEELKIQNEIANAELEENKKKIVTLTEQIQSLRENSKRLEAMENIISELSKMGKQVKKLQADLAAQKWQFENQYRGNEKLEKDLNFKLAENERLQSEIKELNKNIERLSNEALMPEVAAKQLLDILPDRICDRIEKFRSQLNFSESEGRLFQSEINEWRAKSREDALLIQSLRRDLKLYNDKAADQDKTIVALQKSNADLKNKLDEIQPAIAEYLSVNSTEARIDKLSSHFQDELRRKEAEIAELTCYLETMKVERESLMNEKTELSALLKTEKDSCQSKLAELQQNYNTHIKQIGVNHNASIKRLEAQYEESIGKPFNSETWLKSLSPKEKLELHKRICLATPCETLMSETSKIRALNDRQNQQLQEQMRSSIIHLRNDHYKEPAIGSPYMYERRKFDTAGRGTAESTFKDNFDAKRLDFIYHCANQHKNDSSH